MREGLPLRGNKHLKNNMHMNKKKSLYEVPTTDVLVVRFEGALMKVSGDNEVFQQGGIFDGEYEDE